MPLPRLCLLPVFLRGPAAGSGYAGHHLNRWVRKDAGADTRHGNCRDPRDGEIRMPPRALAVSARRRTGAHRRRLSTRLVRHIGARERRMASGGERGDFAAVGCGGNRSGSINACSKIGSTRSCGTAQGWINLRGNPEASRPAGYFPALAR